MLLHIEVLKPRAVSPLAKYWLRSRLWKAVRLENVLTISRATVIELPVSLTPSKPCSACSNKQAVQCKHLHFCSPSRDAQNSEQVSPAVSIYSCTRYERRVHCMTVHCCEMQCNLHMRRCATISSTVNRKQSAWHGVGPVRKCPLSASNVSRAASSWRNRAFTYSNECRPMPCSL
jgi:hypothetical protein